MKGLLLHYYIVAANVRLGFRALGQAAANVRLGFRALGRAAANVRLGF